ncbi:MAG: alanine--tRNA ligase [Patescibacteria group bacterium]|nr:alanine--tRNA ligase [Patescibacteria group bacterium]MDE2437845.1 alanine--tRNA ligase [Patescibacteria group bacterium]
MSTHEIRKKYLEFFKKRGHTVIPSSSLLPEGDVTTLFTGSGMQPLIKYLLGEAHPGGKRLTDAQKCVRAEDIDEVGDNRHTTFFEMLGNWSFGDYFKEEQLPWFFEFLTDEVDLDPQKVYVTVFAGDTERQIPRDEESVAIWKALFAKKGITAEAVVLDTEQRASEKGMQGGRIFYYGVKKNWWSRAGTPENMPPREPGGPDSEVFYEFTSVPHDPAFGAHCHPNCDCGRFVEIGNSVFMEYRKNEDGSFSKLAQRNVDFGGGLERIAAASLDDPDIFNIDILKPLILAIRAAAVRPHIRSERIITDHIRASIFLIGDGVIPSNKERGYLLRRLIRRAVMHGQYLIGLEGDFWGSTIDVVIDSYTHAYPELSEKRVLIREVFMKEQAAFARTYESGIKEFEKIAAETKPGGVISGADTFLLLATHGFPIELTEELAAQKGIGVDKESFAREVAHHRELSRAGQEKKFGGHGLLLDTGELKARNEEELKKVTRLHTATHLLQAALRNVLGNEVGQKGSDITTERTRFDFTFPRKLTKEEIQSVENLVNKYIKMDLPVQYKELPKEEAVKTGALYFFKEKYPEVVKVYYAGHSLEDAVSKEFCGGPHVAHTREVGVFKIAKEEAVAAGVRRIRGVIEP